MKKNIFLILSIVLILFSSCSITQTTTSKTLDIYGPGVVQNPVLVDLDVSETKVTGTSEGSSTNIEAIKQDAVANAIEKSNADILVEPKFKTETSGGKTKATVTGYPATYKNFRPLREEDIKLLKAGITQKAVTHQPIKIKKNKPKNSKFSTILFTGIISTFLLITLSTFLL